MDELGPGAALLLMGLVVAILMGCDAAVGRAIVANWRDRDCRRSR